jgi:hypothetical protein
VNNQNPQPTNSSNLFSQQPTLQSSQKPTMSNISSAPNNLFGIPQQPTFQPSQNPTISNISPAPKTLFGVQYQLSSNPSVSNPGTPINYSPMRTYGNSFPTPFTMFQSYGNQSQQ